MKKPKTKVHRASLRMYLNAGMLFPVCYSNAKLLDVDKANLRTTSDPLKVTCKHCKRQEL